MSYGKDVIPSIYNVRGVENLQRPEAAPLNFILRNGEVKRIHYPEDNANVSKKFIEYDVWAEHRGNDTTGNKWYHNCCLLNPFAGFADKSFYTLRADTDSSKVVETPGLGSKVLLLCVNGSEGKVVILGGLREATKDSKDSDKGEKEKGHHAYFVFNGVKFSVNDDGSWEMVCGGPTDTDGTARKDENNQLIVKETDKGTTIKVDKTGGMSIFTKDNKEQITIDHVNSAISIKTEKTVTIQSPQIFLGKEADEKLVLGNKWASLMGDLISALTSLTVPTAVGPSGPPINSAQIAALKQKLQACLSDFVFTKKAP